MCQFKLHNYFFYHLLHVRTLDIAWLDEGPHPAVAQYKSLDEASWVVLLLDGGPPALRPLVADEAAQGTGSWVQRWGEGPVDP